MSKDFGSSDGARRLVVASAVVSMLLGAVLLRSDSIVGSLAGVALSSLVPSVLLGLHAQWSHRRTVLAGEYLGGAFIWFRRFLVVAAVGLAGLHGYRFALALEAASLR